MRGHRIAVGDLILTRHNDASIPLRDPDDPTAEPSPVRNGQRWEVVRINRDNNRLAARRLDDNVLGVFTGGYVQEHITHGYAVTVHSAQGVTADTSHAVLCQNSERRLLYVAMTRGRHANTAHIYQRAGEAHEYSRQLGTPPLAVRGTDHVVGLVRGIVANDLPVITAHDYSTQSPAAFLPSAR
ncbi:ATP-binding domain-containing protein [Mycolicibacterium sp. YH-1]|uniref:ATP-binding domain-containing protein n=1 Tax=Mycolicibacterium sp. YH-1 TaxID=2908837 RepID=UPI001F4BF679|nr:ATP-binding domain-containing protein [Mycolicibacterium sp. YH-1]UNB50918.1 ATP-binding domain-containing protein [Mycolicibacterium sp. YH-1]